jgi:hypothetical protein
MRRDAGYATIGRSMRRSLLLAVALMIAPATVALAHADTGAATDAKSLRERAAKLEADAANDRATVDKGRKAAALALKAANDQSASAAKLRAQAKSMTDPKACAKAEADAAALEKEAVKTLDEASQLEAAVIAVERRAKKLAAEAKRLRKQADAIDGK